MKSLTLAELDTLSAVDIKTVDPEQLVDIRDISIHTELPREERILDFIRQIRNPYCFRHGKIVVKIGFSEAAKETTMEEQFESYLRTLQIPDTNGTEKNTWTLTVPCCIIEIGQNSHSNRCWD